ncbi:cellulose-binding domain-containing protein [Streptomyces tagetis]|uniref:Cellulose-binding domain-containing protein n=1 Tax=Streptomyces tagetis TaxID=2820809 RepID=A0A941B5J7_9ACTN|nr:cellulose-binding domain-containing protein [Streptomyces sp. RG38]MBQ0825403.1 cellulose-binding domain-containing protein [Streptomyces sp. RG38]
MPDLPSRPQEAAEAALPAVCRDTVLSYAGLCAAGPDAAGRLATEAFARGAREIRAGGTDPAARRPPRLPAAPLLLTAVRTTAADWEAAGRGDELAPGLRRWLASRQAARYTGPPQGRPLALRALRDMRPADAELLWLADVEALPLAVVARRLGLDPDTASDELAEARELFRERCRRGHADAPPAPGCRRYTGLLDAVTRTPGIDVPDDLARHLADCTGCADAAACLRPPGPALPVALADGVLGWGGRAHVERRRRAAERRPGPALPAPGEDGDRRRSRRVRAGLLATAVLVSLPALAVSLRPFGGDDPGTPAPRDGDDRRAVAAARPSPPDPVARTSPDLGEAPVEATTAAPETPDPPTSAAPPPPSAPSAPAPRTTATPRDAAPDPAPAPGMTAPPACRVRYQLVNQWADGFQATVTVTSDTALDSWDVAWTFPDGQRIGQMWDAVHAQDGDRVTAGATSYNQDVPAGGRIAFGFVATWHGANSPPPGFTLNGRACATG